jgi:hypothetical protein
VISLHGSNPERVINGHHDVSVASALPPKADIGAIAMSAFSVERVGMSAECHFRTYVLHQFGRAARELRASESSMPTRNPSFYRKHGATSSHMSCSERMTFSLLSSPPQLSSARTPLRPSLLVKYWRRIATDAGVPIITLLRSASS